MWTKVEIDHMASRKIQQGCSPRVLEASTYGIRRKVLMRVNSMLKARKDHGGDSDFNSSNRKKIHIKKRPAVEPLTGFNTQLQALAQKFPKHTLLEGCSGKKHRCLSVIHLASREARIAFH